LEALRLQGEECRGWRTFRLSHFWTSW
jgi:hypothetical protein